MSTKRMRFLGTFLVVLSLSALLVAPAVIGADEEKPTFYWISHGQSGDPIWIHALRGARKARRQLNVNVKTSFHQNDISTHQEAFKSAIAAGADGIASTAPEQGVLKDEIEMAKERGIPVVLFNTDDKATERDAYIGVDNEALGRMWANYLVDHDLVEEGDFVWMPVEVPGATYQRLETRGIKSVFDPLGIQYEVFDAKYDPVQSLQNMKNYLSSHKDKVDAIIGLGDMVMGNMKATFDTAGVKPGDIPVVGWGNSSKTARAVREGYVNAAAWQYPTHMGYMPIVLLHLANQGVPIGYDTTTIALYEEGDADKYLDAIQVEE